MGKVGKNSLIVLAVLAVRIGGRKIVGLVNAARRVVRMQEVVVGEIEAVERVGLILGQTGKIEPAAIERSHRRGGRHTHYSMRPVEITLRVYHPPFPVNLLHIELPRCLISRATFPPSVNVPIVRSRMRREILFLRKSRPLQIPVRVHLTRPVPVFVLAVGIHKREECRRVQLHCLRSAALSPDKFHVGDGELHSRKKVHAGYDNGVNVRKINIIGEQPEFTGIWSAVHETECAIHLRMRHIRAQRKLDRHFGASRDIPHRLVDSCNGPIRPITKFRLAARIKHIAYKIESGHVAAVFHRQPYRFIFPQIPFSPEHNPCLPLLRDYIKTSVGLADRASADILHRIAGSSRQPQIFLLSCISRPGKDEHHCDNA